MTPLIGLPGRASSSASAVRGEAISAGARYASAVNSNGGSVVIIPPLGLSTASLRETISRLDGVVLHGGIDIAPSRYGQVAHREVKHCDDSLDDFELNVLRIAIEVDKPVLAICRGMQVLNVLQGGTLVQHIPELLPSEVNHWSAKHDVTVERDSRLFAAVGDARIEEVSSFHHQAVGDLGARLRVTARATDGLIEAIEHSEARWVVGVQWHPEDELESDATRLLFRSFLATCALASPR